MNQVFKTTHTMTFREADPAQIMFFGNIFGWAHDAFEVFIADIGVGWKEYFHRRDIIIPIRHTEAEYFAPFFPGQTYDVEVWIDRVGDSSYTSAYRFSQKGQVHAQVKLVHACADPKTKKKTALPEDLKAALLPYLSSSEGL